MLFLKGFGSFGARGPIRQGFSLRVFGALKGFYLRVLGFFLRALGPGLRARPSEVTF